MTYSLERLAGEIKQTLKADPGVSGKQKICDLVAEVLKDKAFVAKHLCARAPGADPREILYEDEELGFCICGHVYDGEAVGKPHDHGSSWAIYGQAEGETSMTDWETVEPGGPDRPALVEPSRTYLMRPGDVQLYDVGAVHSPHREKPVKLLRIEGQNLDKIQRSNIQRKK
ncbi:MAG: hypothetical protein QNI91_18810 [Arenicellales bacterium]|nr:hypothetical protein [Arenicellales bacterium]